MPTDARATAPPATLKQVVDVVEGLYPARWAEGFDAVGLVVGDLEAPVRKILLAVDPRPEVAAEAITTRADLLLVHHPLFLTPVHSTATDTWGGRVAHDLVRAGCALLTAHTNADRARPGVNDALARVLGLTALEPLEPMPAHLDEPRVAAGPRGLGRVGDLEHALPLRAFAQVVADALPATAAGVKVAGDAEAVVRRVAVCGGSGGSLLDRAAAVGADVMVTSDLRHHPASESRDAHHELALIDVAHWASEWPWLFGAAEQLATALGGAGIFVDVDVSRRRTDPWTFHLPSSGSLLR